MGANLELISVADMKATSAANAPSYTPGCVYRAYDATYGEVEARYVLTAGAVGVAGSPMYPVTASWTVAGKFLVDDNEDASGVVGEELPAGAWLGGVTTAASYGFVLTRGLNPIALVSDGSVTAGEYLCASSTDGTWVSKSRAELNVITSLAVTCGVVGRVHAADTSTAVAAGSVEFNIT